MPQNQQVSDRIKGFAMPKPPVSIPTKGFCLEETFLQNFALLRSTLIFMYTIFPITGVSRLFWMFSFVFSLPCHSHVFHPSVTSEAEGSAVVLASLGSMRSGMPSDDRCNVAQGKVGIPAVGKAASQPERSSQSLLTSSSPHLKGLTSLQWHAKTRAWKLHNQDCNSCCANALTLCLLWLEGYSSTSILQGPVGNSLRLLMQAGTPTDLWSVMCLGSQPRRQPRQQHDVSEFLTFLSRTLNSEAINGIGSRGVRAPP